jgi:hypothetical protein
MSAKFPEDRRGPKLPVRPAFSPDPAPDPTIVAPRQQLAAPHQPGLIALQLLGARVIRRFEV